MFLFETVVCVALWGAEPECNTARAAKPLTAEQCEIASMFFLKSFEAWAETSKFSGEVTTRCVPDLGVNT